jgi:hypothetical protein
MLFKTIEIEGLKIFYREAGERACGNRQAGR